MKKNVHYGIIAAIFIVMGFGGYLFYRSTSNFGNEAEVDTSVEEKKDAISEDSGNDYRKETTKSDENGEKIAIKMESKINMDNGAWDIICTNNKKNQCSASVLIIKKDGDSDFNKKHPVGEYVVIDSDKYSYKVDNNKNNAKGLFFRKRTSN